MSNAYTAMAEIEECNEEMAFAQNAVFDIAKTAPAKMGLYKVEWAKAYLKAQGPVKTREVIADKATGQLFIDAHTEKSLEKANLVNMDRIGKKLMSKMGKLATFRAEANALHSP